MGHLECSTLINDSQHGLRSGRSCVTNLLTFLEDSTKIVDEGGCVDVIYLDFCKAFDKVLHQRLLLRLQMHGIGIKIRNWIGNWLHNRKQRVVVNGVKFKWLPVMSAVSQGSVLGPALLIIYIFDTDANVSSSVPKFSDDTKLHSNVCPCNQTDRLQCDLDKMSEWSTKWKMPLNADKCIRLHVGHSYPSVNYSIGGVEIKNVKAEKDLCVTIGCTMDSSLQCA